MKPNPRLFPFHVYWKCVGEFSYIVLYFPYLVLTLALILVLLERILTRYLWTGQRIEKFYNLLVKEVIECGDIDKVDTKWGPSLYYVRVFKSFLEPPTPYFHILQSNIRVVI